LESLSSQKDFNSFKLKGKKIVSKFFVIVFIAKDHLVNSFKEDSLIFGIKATKKIGNAVTRNKAKRRTKHFLRDLYLLQPNLAKNFAYLIIPRSQLLNTNFETAFLDFLSTLKKIHQER